MTEDVNIFEKVVTVNSNNENSQPVLAARVRLNAKEVERILLLAALGDKHKIYNLIDCSYAAEWGFLDDDEETFIPTEEAGDRNEDGPFRTEGNIVEVYSMGKRGYACWKAYWKYTDVIVSTECINVEELRVALSETGSLCSRCRAAVQG